MKTREMGKHYESLAAEFLERQGLSILEHNFNCKLGEMDLICLDQQKTLLFIEVRFRKTQYFGGGEASINRSKQKKLINTAQIFLKMKPHLANLSCRFDVIAITITNNKPAFNWIQNAFSAY